MQSVESFFAKNQRNLIPWGALVVCLFGVYHLLSDGDFSFLMTVGASLKLFGFSLVLYTVLTTGSAEGLSAKTLQAYAIVYFSRLCSVLYHPGYLPYDSSGDWFYQAVLCTGLVVVIAAMYLVLATFQHTYERQLDSFGAGGAFQLPAWASLPVLCGPAMVLALVRGALSAHLPPRGTLLTWHAAPMR